MTSIVAVLTVSGDIPTDAIQTYMFGSLDNFPLLAVPFFVLAGEFMAQGGIARRIINMVMAIVGGVRGSLAVTTVAASELFGAMSHTAVGTVVAMGRMIYPSLKEGGYNDRFSVGLIASSGAIAVVIPPSIAMILYAVSAEQSAVQLFTAGILPSLLIGVIDAAFVMSYARLKGVPLGVKAHWENDLEDEQGGELVDRFARRDLRRHLWRRVHADRGGRRRRGLFAVRDDGDLPRGRYLPVAGRSWSSSAFLISQILLIVTSAGIYSWLLTTSGIPQQIVASIDALQMPKWELLLILNFGLLIGGKLSRTSGGYPDPDSACCCRSFVLSASTPFTSALSSRSISVSACTRRRSA